MNRTKRQQEIEELWELWHRSPGETVPRMVRSSGMFSDPEWFWKVRLLRVRMEAMQDKSGAN